MIQSILTRIQRLDTNLVFQDIIAIIDQNYIFVPKAFKNGEVLNQIGENSGSCKVFSFAKLNDLSETETLHCFGQYYQDVLNAPEDSDHQNIRSFIKYGWAEFEMETLALTPKA